MLLELINTNIILRFKSWTVTARTRMHSFIFMMSMMFIMMPMVFIVMPMVFIVMPVVFIMVSMMLIMVIMMHWINCTIITYFTFTVAMPTSFLVGKDNNYKVFYVFLSLKKLTNCSLSVTWIADACAHSNTFLTILVNSNKNKK